jgi:hypothetical protein
MLAMIEKAFDGLHAACLGTNGRFADHKPGGKERQQRARTAIS